MARPVMGDVGVDRLPPLPASNNNIGDVDVLTMPPLPAGNNNIGDVDVLTLPPLPAGEAHVGAVGGHTVPVTVAPTVSTSPAYSAGDAIGGKLTLAGAVRVSGGAATLVSLYLLDRSNQKPTGIVLFFNADPTAATLTDNALVALSTDDAKVVGSVTIGAGDWQTIAGQGFATLRNVGLALKASSGTSLYAVFAASGTPTFTSTTALRLTFGFSQD